MRIVYNMRVMAGIVIMGLVGKSMFFDCVMPLLPRRAF